MRGAVVHGEAFKGWQFTDEVILWAVRWYLMFPVSYRDLELMLEDRGVSVDYSAAVLPEDYNGGTTQTNWQVASVWLYSPTIRVHVYRFLLNGQARTVTKNLGSSPVSTFSPTSIATPVSWWPA
jgi:hypothetical protein